MKRGFAVVTALIVGAMVSACVQMSTGPEPGWVALIDGGRGLENFIGIGDANWRVEGDAIVADKGKGGYLITRKSYKDFQIRAEFWADTSTNSGIFLRMSDRSAVTSANSYEVNIYDLRPEAKYGTGAIVDVAAVVPMPKAGGQWNTYEITAKGPRMTVVLNGAQTVDVQHAKFGEGPFALQFANGPNDAPGGAIKWRKVYVKEL